MGCGHPGALHRIHNSQCVCQNGARKVSSAAVASLRTAAQIWRTDILVLCTAFTSAVGWAYVIGTWRPKRIVRRGRLAAHCSTDLAYGHPGALHSIHIRDAFAIRYAKMAPARGHPPRSFRFALQPRPGVRTSWCPAHHPHAQWVCPTVCLGGTRDGSSAAVVSLRLASHCGTDLAYGHPGALRSFDIRREFAVCYSNIAPKTDCLPRSPRLTLRHRPRLSIHRHSRWVSHTVCKKAACKELSAAVTSLCTVAQTWCTDIRVPCIPSTCGMGLSYGVRRWNPRGIIRCVRLASHCGPELGDGHASASDYGVRR